MRNAFKRSSVAAMALAWVVGTGCSDDESERRVDASSTADGLQDASADVAASEAALLLPDAMAPDAESDANADAAASLLNVVYATFNGTLVRIDPDNATVVPVGKLRNKANEAQLYTDVVMHWSGAGDTALAVLDYANPQLGTVDLCTGLVTPGALITRTASPNLVVEGLALHPNGTWFASGGNPANKQSPISNHIGTLNTTSGVFTDLGAAVMSFQDDGDGLFFRGETLYGFDVATTNNRLDVFTINLTTGANTNVLMPTYGANLVPLRTAYDASRDKAFAWRAGDRQLIEISLTENIVRPLFATHAANLYANQPSRGFFVAPSPRCP